MPLIRHNMTKWLILALMMIVPIIPFYLINETQYPIEHAYSSPTAEFQVYEGDLSEGMWEDPTLEWVNYDYRAHGHDKVTGTYWFRIQLPESEWRNPHLLFYYLKNLDMYLDGEHLYDWNRHAKSPYVDLIHAHLIELPEDYSQQMLYIRSDFQGMYLHPGHFFIDSKYNLIAQALLTSNYRIALGCVSLLIGITGLLVFARHRERSVLYFSLFALYIVYMCLGRSWLLFSLFIPYGWLPYLHNVMLALGGYFFLRFFEFIFGEGPFKIHRRLWQVFLILIVVMAVTAMVSPTFYFYVMTDVLENIIAPLTLAIVFVTSIMTYRRKRDAESFWFMAGFVMFAIFSCYYFVQKTMLPLLRANAPDLAALIEKGSALFYNNDRFLQTFFVLLFCMVMIVGERIRALYFEAKETSEQLRAMSESLEQLVQERTSELEDANVNLRASMLATSQALAANAVLEDRNRIARDMHDKVGHTLTAALFQIDAAKMLIEIDEQQALEKMTASRESVNMGLESIRDTVMKMKQDYETDDLHTSIRKLIANVQESTGVVVKLDVDEDLVTAGRYSMDDGDPNMLSLSPAVKKMIYHALQEGITNGIKHANATQFACSLRLKNGSIAFRLTNNGDKYTERPYGFGLQAMKDRVDQLGGRLHISDNDGTGCLLAIDVPVNLT